MTRRILLSFVGAFALLGLSVTTAHSQDGQAKDEINVLFIGNSLTYGNDLPKMIAALAKAGKQPSMHHERETPGGCGFDGFQVGKSHRAEIGYWLAKPLWGRGIMTAVVQRVCRHAFEELGLVKITAHVFSHNPASARVLAKCGFQQEGFLCKHYVKDDKFIDARLFALLR